MADAPDPITSPPSVPPAPYDAASDAPVGRWVKSSQSGPCDMQFSVSGDWPDSGVWRQV